MGREIRRVPPHWEHPRDSYGNYQPMRDSLYKEAAEKWIKGFILWEDGDDPCRAKYPDIRYFWDWEGMPPEEKYFRPDFQEEPTWYQVYETVSEGTPVSPPFATKEEVIDYLVVFGDFWDQHRGYGGHSRENAEAFVNSGWCPSGLLTEKGFVQGIDSCLVED